MMGGDAALFLAGGCRDDLEAPVELQGIGIDDLTIEGPGQTQSMGRFSGGRRSAQVERVEGRVQNRDPLFSGGEILGACRTGGQTIKIPVSRSSRGCS